MEVHVLTWIIDIFFIFTLHILAKKVLGVKRINKIVFAIGWCWCFLGWNLLSYLFAEIPLVNGIGCLGLVLAVICWLYDGKLQNKIIITFAIAVLGITAETIIAFIYMMMGIEVNSSGTARDEFIYIGSIISKVLFFIFVKIIIAISNSPKKVKIRMTDWIEIFIVPVGSLIIFHIVAWDNYFAITMPKVVVFAVLLTINFLSYYVYQRMQMQAEEVLESRLLKQQSEYYKARYEDAEKQWATLRKIRHDLKNNYVLHMHYLEKRQYEKLKESYEKVLGELTCEGSIIHTGNVGIDSIVNFKVEMAKELNIIVRSKAEVLSEIRTDYADMNILLGNLLDNAIEAVTKLPEKDRWIDLRIRADETAMLVEISNPFDGVLKKDDQGKFITIKKNKDSHGVGIRIIEGVVKKYNGLFEINTKGNCFATKAFLYYLEE